MFQNQTSLLSEDSLLQKIQELALVYKGTRNYHNFTTKVQFSHESAKRFISQINVELMTSKDFPEINHSVPYVKFTIEGHGFLYHQIRKMIGLIIQIMNDQYAEKEIMDVFGDNKINIWLAPGAGLFLKEVQIFFILQKKND